MYSAVVPEKVDWAGISCHTFKSPSSHCSDFSVTQRQDRRCVCWTPLCDNSWRVKLAKTDKRPDLCYRSSCSVISVTFHRATKEIHGHSLGLAPQLSVFIDDNKEQTGHFARRQGIWVACLIFSGANNCVWVDTDSVYITFGLSSYCLDIKLLCYKSKQVSVPTVLSPL